MVMMVVGSTQPEADQRDSERPSDRALRAAREAVAWADGFDLRLRLGFLRQDHRRRPESASPPMAQLLRATGGLDAVRLKLAVSCIWLAMRQRRPEIAPQPRFWADLLDLSDPSRRGTRRVRDGLVHLRKLSLIDTERQGPAPSLIRLRREDGSGDLYQRPRGDDPTDYYFHVPVEFWTNGWLAALSGPAIAALLIAMSAQSFHAADEPIWLTGHRFAAYDLSADTWQAGLRELAHFRLVHREVVRRPSYDLFASHSTIYLDHQRLREHQVTPTEWRHLHQPT